MNGSDSNTTNVKVKRIASAGFVGNPKYSNTTNVKVKPNQHLLTEHPPKQFKYNQC